MIKFVKGLTVGGLAGLGLYFPVDLIVGDEMFAMFASGSFAFVYGLKILGSEKEKN